MLFDWLGSRDSNPNTVVQSHVSCHWTTPQHRWDANCRPTLTGVNFGGPAPRRSQAPSSRSAAARHGAGRRLVDSRCRGVRSG